MAYCIVHLITSVCNLHIWIICVKFNVCVQSVYKLYCHAYHHHYNTSIKLWNNKFI